MDEQIKKKLEEISPEYDPKSWDALQDKLVEESIKTKLEDTSYVGAAGAWSAFEQKLESDQANWDQNIKEKLTDLDPTVEGWTVLEEKWAKWEEFRQRFVTLRIAEVIIILLLLWGVYNWSGQWDNTPFAETTSSEELQHFHGETPSQEKNGPTVGQHTQLSTETEAQSAKLSNDFSETDAEDLSQSLSGTDQKEIGSNTARITKSHSPTTAHLSDQNSSDSKVGVSQSKIQKKSNSFTEEEGVLSSIISTSNVQNSTTIINGNQATRSVPNQTLEGNLTVAKAMESSRFKLITDPIAGMNYGQLMIAPKTITQEDPIVTYGRPPAEPSNSAPIWLSVYGTAGVNQIKTPGVDTFSAKNYLNGFNGLGIRFEFENGKWFLTSGLEYHRTNLLPQRELVEQNNNGGLTFITLEKSQIDFLTIPVLAQYTFLEKDRTSWYALGGARLHMSSKIRYTFGYEYIGATNTEPIDAQAIHGVSDVNFTYLTINLGLGYQYRMGLRTSVFASLTTELFGQNNSLLPSGEMINTLRADVGLRYRL